MFLPAPKFKVMYMLTVVWASSYVYDCLFYNLSFLLHIKLFLVYTESIRLVFLGLRTFLDGSLFWFCSTYNCPLLWYKQLLCKILSTMSPYSNSIWKKCVHQLSRLFSLRSVHMSSQITVSNSPKKAGTCFFASFYFYRNF